MVTLTQKSKYQLKVTVAFVGSSVSESRKRKQLVK